jgi:hypothetical protein
MDKENRCMKHQRFAAAGLFLMLTSLSVAVNSVMLRHQTGADFLKGKPENIIIDSSGTLRLTRQSTPLKLDGLLDDVWAVNTMIADGSKVYLGTGPDAKVIRLSGDTAEQIYPILTEDASSNTRPSVRNEHVFALAQDVAGRLLIGISGKSGKLVRLSGGNAETVFEDDRVQYIFAIALDADNNIYLATGPNGLLMRLNPFGQNPEVIYDARDRSLLSLAVKDGIVYAGGDQRGLVYRIDPETRRATVLYDADQDEITALLIDSSGDLYAAAASAGAAMLQLQSSTPSLGKSPGRPDTDNNSSASLAESVKTPDSSEDKQEKEDNARPQQTPPPPPARAAGHIYKISPEGFVTDVFSEMAVLYSLTKADGKLWLGTGNKGELFTIDPSPSGPQSCTKTKPPRRSPASCTSATGRMSACPTPPGSCGSMHPCTNAACSSPTCSTPASPPAGANCRSKPTSPPAARSPWPPAAAMSTTPTTRRFRPGAPRPI